MGNVILMLAVWVFVNIIAAAVLIVGSFVFIKLHDKMDNMK